MSSLDLDVKTLLKLLLVLVLVWVVLEVFAEFLGPFTPVLAAVALILLVFWLLDHI